MQHQGWVPFGFSPGGVEGGGLAERWLAKQVVLGQRTLLLRPACTLTTVLYMPGTTRHFQGVMCAQPTGHYPREKKASTKSKIKQSKKEDFFGGGIENCGAKNILFCAKRRKIGVLTCHFPEKWHSRVKIESNPWIFWQSFDENFERSIFFLPQHQYLRLGVGEVRTPSNRCVLLSFF